MRPITIVFIVSVVVTFERPDGVAEIMDDVSWDDYVTVDDDMITNKTLEENWEEEILQRNPSQEAAQSDDEEEEGYELIRDVITHRVASAHLEDLKIFALVHEDQEMMKDIEKCQNRLISRWSIYKNYTTQTAITDFF